MNWKELYNMAESGSIWRIWNKCPNPYAPKDEYGRLEVDDKKVYLNFSGSRIRFEVTPQAHGNRQINPSHLEILKY